MKGGWLMRIVHFGFFMCFLLGIFANISHSETRMISLNSHHQSSERVEIYQNVPIKINNSFISNLYDLTLTKSSSPKNIFSVDKFKSGESFDLSFPKDGNYEICFSKKKNDFRTCLDLVVLKGTQT
jgi:hypothetical protein